MKKKWFEIQTTFLLVLIYSCRLTYFCVFLHIINYKKNKQMKKSIRTFLLLFITAIATTSCVKDWTCVCTDGTTTINQVYKNTKLTTAADKCDDREANLRLVVPATNCSIK